MPKCSPACALDTKIFFCNILAIAAPICLDAVKQFGLPDVFVSQYEWSFPFAQWLGDIRQKTARAPTALSGYETANIGHTLGQVVGGYLCRSNSQKWSEHIFSCIALQVHQM